MTTNDFTPSQREVISDQGIRGMRKLPFQNFPHLLTPANLWSKDPGLGT